MQCSKIRTYLHLSVSYAKADWTLPLPTLPVSEILSAFLTANRFLLCLQGVVKCGIMGLSSAFAQYVAPSSSSRKRAATSEAVQTASRKPLCGIDAMEEDNGTGGDANGMPAKEGVATGGGAGSSVGVGAGGSGSVAMAQGRSKGATQRDRERERAAAAVRFGYGR